MQKIIKYFLLIFILLNFKVLAKENFFQEAKDLFDKGKIEESKFLFQRNIVFNPKNAAEMLKSMKNKTQTREQKIAARLKYNQQQAQK